MTRFSIALKEPWVVVIPFVPLGEVNHTCVDREARMYSFAVLNLEALRHEAQNPRTEGHENHQVQVYWDMHGMSMRVRPLHIADSETRTKLCHCYLKRKPDLEHDVFLKGYRNYSSTLHLSSRLHLPYDRRSLLSLIWLSEQK